MCVCHNHKYLQQSAKRQQNLSEPKNSNTNSLRD